MTDLNKLKIKLLTENFLADAYIAMEKKIEKAIQSGSLDIDSWEENNNPAIIPKIIVTALLEDESKQWSCEGSSFQKEMRKEINNLKLFL